MASVRHNRSADAHGVDTSSFDSTTFHDHGIIRRDFASSRKVGKGATRKPSSASNDDATEGSGTQDEDDDSSGGQDDQEDEDEEDNEDDDPAGIAPFGGLGKGAGKRPIKGFKGRKPMHCHRAGLSVNAGLNKKRTFSDVSSHSVLRESGSNPTDFPRHKSSKLTSTSTDNEPTVGLGNFFGPNAPALVEEAIETDDDDDYRAVDLISNSDGEGPDMEQLEEQAIIESEDDFDIPRRASLTSSDSDSDYQLGTEGIFPTDNFFDEQFHRDQPAATLELQADGINGRKDSSHRRVHFDDEVRTSDSGSTFSTEHDFSLYPDLEILESGIGALDNASARQDESLWFAYEQSEHSDSSSYWDLQEEQALAGPETDSDLGTVETSSSGYESDTGDTTDEDLPPETTVHTPSTLLHRRPSSSTDSSSRSRSSRRSTKSRANQKPKLASWKVDPTKTIAIIDSSGKRMLLFPAREPQVGNIWTESTASTISNQSPRTPFQSLTTEDSDPSDFSGQIGSPDVMLNGAFGNVFGNDIIGPPEAFFPFVNFDANGHEVASDDGMEMDDLTDNENMISLNDIIDCGDDTDDELEAPQDQETTDTTEATDFPTTPITSKNTQFGSTPASVTPGPPSTGRLSFDAHEMLSHFDRGIVNSFRANQNRCRTFLRQPQQHAMRSSMARPLRNGRASDALITPVRKRRGQGSVDMTGSPIGKKGPISGPFGPPLRRTHTTDGMTQAN